MYSRDVLKKDQILFNKKKATNREEDQHSGTL